MLIGNPRAVARVEGDEPFEPSRAELHSLQLGSVNTEEQIDHVISILPNMVTKLRSMSSVGGRLPP